MPSSHSKQQRLAFRLAGLIFVAIAIALGLADILIDREETRARAFDRLSNLARITDEMVSGRLRTVDQMLQDVGSAAQEYIATSAPQGDARALEAYMSARADSLEAVRAIAVTNADGQIIHVTMPELAALDVSQRDYYKKAQAQSDVPKMALNGPMRTATGAIVLLAVRPRPMENGRWTGATIASLPPAYFADIMETVWPQQGFVSLVGFDGTLLARVPGHETHSGKNVGKGMAHAGHVASGARETRWATKTIIDGDHYFIVSRNTDFPELMVSIGQREDDVMTEWRRKSAIKGLILAALAVVAWFTLRRFGKHEAELRHERNIARQAQEELAASQRFLTAITDNVPDVIGYWDAEQRCRFANPPYWAWFGRKRDEVIGMTLLELQGPTLYALNRPFVEGALRGEPQDFQRTVIKADGSTGYAWVHYMPDVGADGQVNGFYVLVNDITSLKNTELQLRAASARLSLAAAAAGIGVWEYDLRTREAAWDRRMYELYGLEADDDRPAYSLWVRALHPADLSRVEAEFNRAVDECRDFAAEFRILTPNGGIRHLRAAAKPDFDADGSPERMIGVNWDITAVRENEAALAAARAAAESASRAKSEFLANMSHEIRTPMNAILGLTHLLERSGLTDEQQRLVADIDVSGRTLLGLISDILDFSRVEAGRLELEKAVFRLSDLMCAVQAIMSGEARRKGLKLSLTIADNVPDGLIGDSLRLQQVATNLVGNAVKFTEQGEVSISVEATEWRDGRATLKFAVADTGPGAPPERLTRLFDAFTQGDPSTTRRFGGSGLGLSICKRLVEAMGGDIGAESAPGRGSRFWFTAPFAVAEPTDAETAAEIALSAACDDGAPRLAGLRLLVAEDNKINQDVLRRVLELEGAAVDLAGDGAQAAKLAAPNAFDAVLMDLQMPELDGCDAARLIRRQLGDAAPPIIALTAGALDVERERALQAGMCDFIAKPFDLDRMIQAILRAAGRQAAASRRAAPPQSDLTIPGVETAEALQRMGGDADLQKRIMQAFVDQMGDAAALATAEWRDGAAQTAARRLHALKGAAANVGAVELAAAAGRAERLLRQEAPAALEAAAALATLEELSATLVRDTAQALAQTQIG